MAVTMFDNGYKRSVIAKQVKKTEKQVSQFLIDYITRFNCDWFAYTEDQESEEYTCGSPKRYCLESSDEDEDLDTWKTSNKGKMTAKKATKICLMYDEKIPHKDIGEEVGLSVSSIRKFAQGHIITPGLWHPWRDRRPKSYWARPEDPELMLLHRRKPLITTNYIEKKKKRERESA